MKKLIRPAQDLCLACLTIVLAANLHFRSFSMDVINLVALLFVLIVLIVAMILEDDEE
jgi:predicted RND superfamily exporter protein